MGAGTLTGTGKECLAMILAEGLRPGNRTLTDAHTTANYTPLLDRLEWLHPAWKASLLTFTMDIHWLYTPDRLTVFYLIILLLMGGQAGCLLLDLASKAMKELTELYTAAAATVTTSM